MSSPRYVVALVCSAAASSVVIAAALYGAPESEFRLPTDALSRWDGVWYEKIAATGYSYTPSAPSNVAFFPGYPSVGRLISGATGIPISWALVIAAHLFLLAAFVLFALYLGSREGEPPGEPGSARPSRSYLRPFGTSHWQSQWHTFALASLALFPTTFFFRMAYSESLFLFLILAVFVGMVRRWPTIWIVVLAGLATAVRPVGIALIPPLAVYLWRRGATRPARIGNLLWLPLACWGLIAYMVFQYVEFGDALAFAKTQAHWRMARPSGDFEKALALASYEPIWSVYVPDTPSYWRNQTQPDNAFLNLAFANPIYFVGVSGLIVVGAWKRWLNGYEVLLSIGLLGIPYVTRAYEMCMASQGRFAAVVFPAYIVMGHLLARVPRVVAFGILAIFAFYLCVYSAQFGAGYGLI
jgi:hypothetical protein